MPSLRAIPLNHFKTDVDPWFYSSWIEYTLSKNTCRHTQGVWKWPVSHWRTYSAFRSFDEVHRSYGIRHLCECRSHTSDIHIIHGNDIELITNSTPFRNLVNNSSTLNRRRFKARKQNHPTIWSTCHTILRTQRTVARQHHKSACEIQYSSRWQESTIRNIWLMVVPQQIQ